MKKASILFAAVVFCLSASVYAQTYGVVLTGAQEVPGPGDPDGFGTATIGFNADRTQMTLDATFTGIGTAITGAHIHGVVGTALGARGSDAGVLINFAPPATITTGRMNLTASGIPAATAADIVANPQNYYLNIHTPPFPAGAIRGQLAPTGGVVFAGDLRGAREVPAPGHATATGSFVLTLSGTTVTWFIATQGLGTITASHVHGSLEDLTAGREGAAAGVLFNLGTGSSFVNGVSTGSIEVTPAMAAAITANPQNFYVNVHTTDFPAGAIRGQLVRTSAESGNVLLLPVIGRVSNATETFVTDVRIFNPSFDQTAAVTLEFFPANAAPITRGLTIPPRGTAVLNNIVGDLFGQTSAIGGARITSPFRVVATETIFSDRRPTGGGTIGQFFPAMSPLRRGVLAGLSHTSSATTGRYRTNVGLFNPNDVSVFVRLELRDNLGALVASTTLALAPKQFRQDAIPVLFTSVTTFNEGSLTFDADAPIVAYGSLVDHVTSDTIAVLPVEDPFVPTTP